MSGKIDKIKKLLALSKSNNEHEAALALAAAMRMAAEENIDIGELRLDDEEILSQEYSLEPQSRKIEWWKNHLWLKIARLFGCAIYLNTFYVNGNARSRIKIAGRKSDIEVADYVGCYLTRELQKLWRKEIAAVRKRRKISLAKLKESFLLGAASRVVGKAECLFGENRQSDISTAYEIIISRSKKAEQWIDQLADMRPVKYRDRIDDKAFIAGRLAGSTVGIHKAVNGSDCVRRKLL